MGKKVIITICLETQFFQLLPIKVANLEKVMLGRHSYITFITILTIIVPFLRTTYIFYAHTLENNTIRSTLH